jgi:hypothetical protein
MYEKVGGVILEAVKMLKLQQNNIKDGRTE